MNRSTKASASSRPTSERAANCSPAAHPSVASVTRSTTSGSRSTCGKRSKNSSASSGRNRRSASRSSTSSPARRNRCSCNGGSDRLQITSAQARVGDHVDQPRQQRRRGAAVEDVQVVEHDRGPRPDGEVPDRAIDRLVGGAVLGVTFECGLEHARGELLDGQQHGVEEVLRIGVAGVERQPGHRVGLGHGPVADRHRLARSRRPRDDDQPGPLAPDAGRQSFSPHDPGGEVR